MTRVARFACVCCGSYYSVVGALLFLAPRFFFNTVAPIGPYNEHYAIDLGSFLLPIGVFLLLAVRYPKWSQPIIALAALASSLHLLSHLRQGFHSVGAVLGDAFFFLVVALLIAPLVPGRKVPS